MTPSRDGEVLVTIKAAFLPFNFSGDKRNGWRAGRDWDNWTKGNYHKQITSGRIAAQNDTVRTW